MNHRFEFQKRGQLFIRMHNETLSVVAMCVGPFVSQTATLKIAGCSFFPRFDNDSRMSQANPLFGRKTELIWDGKYDDSGRRVAPIRVARPFQTVETVNETAQERQRSLSLFESPGSYGAGEWRNRLIWGDKKYVLVSR